jgi:hypothetical protein
MSLQAGAQSQAARRVADEIDRVAAAWTEMVDLLTDSGVPIPARRTRTDIASITDREGTAELARVCDRCIFGPTPVTDEDAGLAWTTRRRAAGQARAARSRPQRWRSATNPRSFLRSSATSW